MCLYSKCTNLLNWRGFAAILTAVAAAFVVGVKMPLSRAVKAKVTHAVTQDQMCRCGNELFGPNTIMHVTFLQSPLCVRPCTDV